MSQENVEVVRAIFEAWNAREELDALFSRFHPQLIYHPRADEPDPSPHIGRGAYERLVHGFVESFSEVTFEVLELIDAGDHVITSTVLHAVLHGQESASGAGVSDTYVFVYKLRDGLVVEGWEYRTRQEALEAVGLSGVGVSQENVEIVRACIETANSADFDLDPFLDEFYDPEIEFHDVPTLPNAGVHFGREAFRRHVAGYLEAWAESSYEIEDIRAVGDRVVVRGRWGGVGRQSGAHVTGGLSLPATGAVYDFRAGRILRVRQFLTHAEALEAAGLLE